MEKVKPILAFILLAVCASCKSVDSHTETAENAASPVVTNRANVEAVTNVTVEVEHPVESSISNGWVIKHMPLILYKSDSNHWSTTPMPFDQWKYYRWPTNSGATNK